MLNAAYAPPATGELFPEVRRLTPCSICRSRGINPACWRCEARRRLFHVPTAEERARAAAAAAVDAQQKASAEEAHRARFARLAALGRPVRFALLGCGARKLPTPAPARALYTGPLFKGALRYALEVLEADEVVVLSALHGVVELDEVLEPYDVTLATTRKADRERWERQVSYRLEGRFGTLPVDAYFLAGALYAPTWWAPAWTVHAPLEGLSQGERLAFFAAARRAARPTGVP